MWKGKPASIVFPAYNEKEGIAEAVHGFLAVDAVDEIIVVENNSRDRTAVLAAKAGAASFMSQSRVTAMRYSAECAKRKVT
jgi:glycosyltransferase involved in cell wall biosynthesis